MQHTECSCEEVDSKPISIPGYEPDQARHSAGAEVFLDRRDVSPGSRQCSSLAGVKVGGALAEGW